ncbi:MAG: c-type cytochrome [Thermomicrobiales bacterium]
MPRAHAPSMNRQTRRRGALLVALVTVVLSIAACGRATEQEINQALGITPTPTQSAEQIAEATSRAEAAAATRAAQLASGSPESGGAVALAGDAVRGQTQISLWCMQCHGPSGAAPDLLDASGAAATMSPEELLAFLREGTNHGPGPIPNFRVSDQSIADIHAYIQAQAGP